MMIHRKKKTVTSKLHSVQKKDLIMRNLLTSLIKYWKVKTTAKKAFLLKSMSDNFFSRIVRINKKLAEKDARRESIRLVKRIVFGEQEWKKVVNELLPKILESKKTSWFVSSYKLWQRKWDWSEVVLVQLNID